MHKDSVFCCISDENGVVFQEKFGVLKLQSCYILSPASRNFIPASWQWRVQVSAKFFLSGCIIQKILIHKLINSVVWLNNIVVLLNYTVVSPINDADLVLDEEVL